MELEAVKMKMKLIKKEHEYKMDYLAYIRETERLKHEWEKERMQYKSEEIRKQWERRNKRYLEPIRN